MFKKVCGDRDRDDYECVVIDGNFTAQEMMEDVWLRMESMNNYKGFYWSVGSHGNTEDGSHIMHFPGGHGEPETSIDLDAFTAELFGPDNKELHGKIKFATHALCRGPESDVTTYECDARSPQRRTKRAANVRVPIMKAPNAVKSKQKSAQETFLDWLHDTANSRQLIVKASSFECVSVRHPQGTKFYQTHFNLVDKHRDETVRQLLERTIGKISHQGWSDKQDGGRRFTGRQTVTITKDTIGHPSFHYAMPWRSQNIEDIEVETVWSPEAKRHCDALAARSQQADQQTEPTFDDYLRDVL
ncbi:hypothetical protein AAVH_25741 [Aphelenchoides avenae]|nr:hypothetical protein AAVH_25741 [Aphelenchus avenae]